ncbi:hypothetical protein OG21DRAFT_1510570 [Imleria badia]|nr:hypothetical protein OG21DRAFT_1510570 [Imleria badia]
MQVMIHDATPHREMPAQPPSKSYLPARTRPNWPSAPSATLPRINYIISHIHSDGHGVKHGQLEQPDRAYR